VITTNIKIDISKLKALPREALQVGAEGLSQWAELMREHANAKHGPSAHGAGRYQNQTGSLSKSIKQIPVTIRLREVLTGIIAYKEYAAPVEMGHDIKRKGTMKAGKVRMGGIKGTAKAYPFMVPAMEDKKVQEAGIKRLEKVFKRRLGG